MKALILFLVVILGGLITSPVVAQSQQQLDAAFRLRQLQAQVEALERAQQRAEYDARRAQEAQAAQYDEQQRAMEASRRAQQVPQPQSRPIAPVYNPYVPYQFTGKESESEVKAIKTAEYRKLMARIKNQ